MPAATRLGQFDFDFIRSGIPRSTTYFEVKVRDAVVRPASSCAGQDVQAFRGKISS